MTDLVEAVQRSDAREITLRGVCLGAAMTVVFMSANLYLGLKTGLTFSSSIPAATISMSLLTLLGGAGVRENNIVQTQSSAAGTLCNVILVLPGLVLMHFWRGFPLGPTIVVCLLGGLLGVAYSIPLRRVLVVGGDLPFPEGVAAAEVLRSAPARDGGLRDLGLSAVAAAALALCTDGFRLLPDQFSATLMYGRAVFRASGSLSLALIGIGYLVRIGACLALLLGVLIAWGIAVPILTSALPSQPGGPTAAAESVWAEKVRLIGAGVIAVAGLWTVATLVRPTIDRLRPKSGKAGRRSRSDEPADRDVPMLVVGLATLLLSVAAAVLFASFTAGSPFAHALIGFAVAAAVLTALFGFLLAAACGYMAGLLGSSSSPISGIGILATMLVAECLSLTAGGTADAETAGFIAALALFVTSFIVTTCSIANDNLQDLKTGHMLGATPWKQQAALAIGVVAGAVTLGPVLNVLYHAYGFAAALPRPGMSPANALPAPQAALMTQIALGIVQHHLNWTMVAIGGSLGLVFVGVEAWLGRLGFSLPAMTVGIGMYLPSNVVLVIALGGVIAWSSERAIARRAARAQADVAGADEAQVDEVQGTGRRRGVLLASGFLVGESLVGVLLAASDVLVGRSGALAFAGSLQGTLPSRLAGGAIFIAALACFRELVGRVPLDKIQDL